MSANWFETKTWLKTKSLYLRKFEIIINTYIIGFMKDVPENLYVFPNKNDDFLV